MLHTQTVDESTLELLKKLMALPELAPFVLVGGTNLALRLGHRKLGAVAGRGAKKDFWDIHALLPHFDLATMLGYYQTKYPASDPGQVVRSLVYFDDADPQPEPIDLLKITWPEVKASLRNHVRSYTNSIL